MNKLIIFCIFGLVVVLQSVAADDPNGTDEIASINEFKQSIIESVEDNNLTCENYKDYCGRLETYSKSIEKYCVTVLNGYLCENLREGEGLQKLYKQSLDYLYQQSAKIRKS